MNTGPPIFLARWYPKPRGWRCERYAVHFHKKLVPVQSAASQYRRAHAVAGHGGRGSSLANQSFYRGQT